MIKKQRIINNFRKIYALTRKNVKLLLRFKLALLVSMIVPIISIIMPIIVMNTIFEFNSNLGPWNSSNFLIFTFSAYNIYLLKNEMDQFPIRINEEKYWQTLPALIIAPMSRYILLIGIFLSHLILIAPPFIIFLILCYIINPISIITFFAILIIYLLIALVFSSIGLFLSVLAISKESAYRSTGFFLSIIFWLSCVTYPYEIFPKTFQNVINLNPLYYIFDILRLSWIEDNINFTFQHHFIHFIILFSISLSFPIIGVRIFNVIYKKYGISGY